MDILLNINTQTNISLDQNNHQQKPSLSRARQDRRQNMQMNHISKFALNDRWIFGIT